MDICFKKRNILKKRIFSNEGFTMVELIMSMFVFVLILTLATSIFVKIMKAQRGLLDKMAVNNNAGLVLEQMAREIRTGYFFCGEGGSEACEGESVNEIKFINREGELINYTLSHDSIIKGPEGYSLTAPDVSVKKLEFKVTQDGEEKKICNPWRINIVMEVAPVSEPEQSVMVQTTISSRVLPIEAPERSQEVVDLCEIYE